MPGVKIRGVPHPKGSMICRGPRKCPGCGSLVLHRVVEDDGSGSKEWREKVTVAARALRTKIGTRMDGPVVVDCTFVLPRPSSHYGSGRNAQVLRAGAPEYPAGRVGDVDKLARMVLDAITDAELWEDDARVVDLEVRKRYPSEETLSSPGVVLFVDPAPSLGGLL